MMKICSADKYGENCMKTCIDRKCKTASPTCDSVTGQCPDGCQYGSTGVDCYAVCSQGHYGLACNFSCGKCINQEVCDHVTGSCPSGCEPGWLQDMCQECDREHYGPDCTNTCAARHCVTVSACSPSTGQCIGGCQEGWRGLDCLENSSAVSLTVVLAGTVTSVVVINLIVIIGVIMWRRKRKRPKRKANPEKCYYITATSGTETNEPGSEVGSSLPVAPNDTTDVMSSDDEGGYSIIDPTYQEGAYIIIDATDQEEAQNVSNPESDVTAREDDYKPVACNKYENPENPAHLVVTVDFIQD